MSSRRLPRSSLLPVLGFAATALVLGACASLSPRPAPPLDPEVAAARRLIEQRWAAFGDLRTLADLTIRRGRRAQRLSGPLLLRAPEGLRFEALTPLGPPAVVICSNRDVVTIWEVLQNRAYLMPATPDATARWLGLPLAVEDLVALLSGNVRPFADASSGALTDGEGDLGSLLTLTGPTGTQRIWFDPASGKPRQVEWAEGRGGTRVAFAAGEPAGPPQGLRLTALDGSLDVDVRYRNPRMDTQLDPELLQVKLPEDVRIQDFRR